MPDQTVFRETLLELGKVIVSDPEAIVQLKSVHDPRLLSQTLGRLAHRHGLSLDVEALQALLAHQAESSELSDEDLDQVAGGRPDVLSWLTSGSWLTSLPQD